MKKLLIACLFAAAVTMAGNPIVLMPSGPLQNVVSKGIWTSGIMTGQQAAYLFVGAPLPSMLDMSNCPTNTHHIISINVNLTNKLFSALALDNTNQIGFVSAYWWPDGDDVVSIKAPKAPKK